MSRRALLAGAAVATLLALCTACGTGADSGMERIEGTVIEVEGGLAGVDWFVLRTPDGDRRFEPPPDVLFDGGPMSHLSDHLRSGEPVAVVYELVDGEPVVLEVLDAG